VTGTPSDDQIFSCEKSKLYLKQLPKKTRADLSKLLPNADETAIDLLEKLLSFNPHTRITADEALKHPYLYGFESDIKNEQPINVRQIIKNAEQNSSVNIKNVIYEHCLQFNSEMEVAQGQIPCKTIAPEWEAKLCNRLDICGSRTEQYRKMIFEMAEEACCAMDRIYQEQDAADGRDVMTRFRSCENSGDEEKILRAQREVEKMLRIAVIKHRLDINV
jgi:serine/threonine protein kinase